MKRYISILAGAALAALTAATPATAQDEGPIRVGLAYSQSGNLADSAAHYKRAVDLWQEQVNAEGGLLGRQVEIVAYDDRSDPATAARLYERLISSDNVDLLVAPWGSASTATASAVAQKHSRVFINSGGASEQIHERGFDYVFQTAAPIRAYVANIPTLAKEHGLKTMAIFSRDYPAARDMAAVLEEIAPENGIEIVASEYFPAGTTDFSSIIARAREINPDMWVSVGYPNEAIEMIRQLRASNYLPKVFIHNGVSIDDFMDAAGADGEYAFGMSLYEPGLKTKGNEEFAAAFEAKYGDKPGYYSGFAYAGLTVLQEAVEQTGSLDQDALRDTLKTFKTETVLGNHEVDPETGRQVGVGGLLVQVRDGKREIVLPKELQTMEPVVPMPGWDER